MRRLYNVYGKKNGNKHEQLTFEPTKMIKIRMKTFTAINGSNLMPLIIIENSIIMFLYIFKIMLIEKSSRFYKQPNKSNHMVFHFLSINWHWWCKSQLAFSNTYYDIFSHFHSPNAVYASNKQWCDTNKEHKQRNLSHYIYFLFHFTPQMFERKLYNKWPRNTRKKHKHNNKRNIEITIMLFDELSMNFRFDNHLLTVRF